MREDEGRQLRRLAEARDVVDAPADEQAPEAEDEQDAEGRDRAIDAQRHVSAGVLALLGYRRDALPAGVREDREDDCEVEAVEARRVVGVERREGEAAGPGVEEAPDRE